MEINVFPGENNEYFECELKKRCLVNKLDV